MARASIIIPTWNGVSHLSACLPALLQQIGPDDEVIAVDNASSDGSALWLKARYPRVRVLRQEHNLGFAGGCNAGLAGATGKVLLLLNQDVVVAPGWLTAMLEALAEESVGVAGCKLYFPGTRRIQHAGGYIAGPQGWPGHFGRDEEDSGRYDAPAEVEFVTGAAIGARREVFSRIGMLDEDYFMYYEDVDFCRRAHRAGLRVIYWPSAAGTHVETAATAAGTPPFLRQLTRARWRFILKHYTGEEILEGAIPAEQIWVAESAGSPCAGLAEVYDGVAGALPGILAARARDGGADLAPLAGEVADQIAAGLRGLAELARQPAAAPPPVAVSPPAASTSMPIDELPPLPVAVLAESPVLACSPQPPRVPPPSIPLPELLPDLDARATLREHQFRSPVPLMGRMIAFFRSRWNAVSTRWYVLPLAQQQSEFNQLMLQQLRGYEALLRALQARLDALETSADEHRAGIQLLEAARNAQTAALTAHAAHLIDHRTKLADHSARLLQDEARLAQEEARLAQEEARLLQQEERLAQEEARLDGQARLQGLQATRLDVHEGILDDLLARPDATTGDEAGSPMQTPEARLCELGRLLSDVERRLAELEVGGAGR